MEAADESFEIHWYGSNVGHGFTEWGGQIYDPIADARSWQATEAFLKDLFHGVTTGSSQPAQCSATNAPTTINSSTTGVANTSVVSTTSIDGNLESALSLARHIQLGLLSALMPILCSLSVTSM